jgi:hypothetical protein
MEAIFLQIFVSFGLVVGSLLLFAFSTRQREADHADRLALFPIEDEKIHSVDNTPGKPDMHNKNRKGHVDHDAQ